MPRAVGPPRSGGRVRQAAFEQHVAARQPERSRDGEPAICSAVARLDDGDRRQPSAVARLEARRIQRHARGRGRIEEARREFAEPMRIVNLHAVEHDDVVLGAAAAHGHFSIPVVGRRDAGQHLQRAKHVVQAAGGFLNLARLERVGGRPALALVEAIGDIDDFLDADLVCRG